VKPSRVAVLGSGGVGLGMAALLASRGHLPVLWSPSGAAAGARQAGGVLEASGALELRHDVAVTADCARAVAGADAVVLALPANYHRAVIDAVAPHLTQAQTLIISGHLSFGALYLAKRLAGRGLAPPIVAWGTTVTTGRRAGPLSVRVGSVRAKVDACVLPAHAAPAALDLCRALFGDRFVPRADLLAIALSNVNPANHLGIALCNLTRMERGEVWRQNENITDAVGRLLEALDAERLAIAAAFDVGVRSLREHFHLSFHVPPAPVGDMARAMVARGDATIAPASLDTRYVTEDAPFGLYATTLLGRMAGVPATLHAAGLALLSALYGRDLAADNDLLPAIGFAGLTVPDLRRLAVQGWPVAA
jgi:opine dehydrogenase